MSDLILVAVGAWLIDRVNQDLPDTDVVISPYYVGLELSADGTPIAQPNLPNLGIAITFEDLRKKLAYGGKVLYTGGSLQCDVYGKPRDDGSGFENFSKLVNVVNGLDGYTGCIPECPKDGEDDDFVDTGNTRMTIIQSIASTATSVGLEGGLYRSLIVFDVSYNSECSCP